MIEIGNVVDIEHFNTTVLDAYAEGDDDELEADLDTARSVIPSATGLYRDFSYVAPEIPCKLIHLQMEGSIG